VFSNRLIDERETSSFMVSVGTGLMLESLFDTTSARIDESRTIDKIDVNKYTIHYYSVLTLVRNIMSSIKNIKVFLADRYSHKHILKALKEEINIIAALYSDTMCTPILYIPDYTNYHKYKISDQEHNITNKMRLNEYTIECAKLLLKDNQELDMVMLSGDVTLPRDNKDILITTHRAYDLLNYKRIPNLTLIESHTGKLKDNKEFNTKYHSLGKYPKTVFPFTEHLLHFLGDDTMVKPLKFTIRSLLYSIAVENKWTPYTSDTKIRSGINREPTLKEIYKSIHTVF